MDGSGDNLKSVVLDHMNYVAKWTGTDIFLLRPRPVDMETASLNGVHDPASDHRLRIAIFGDVESSEHAKTRMLIMIDQIVRRLYTHMEHFPNTFPAQTQGRYLPIGAINAHHDLWAP